MGSPGSTEGDAFGRRFAAALSRLAGPGQASRRFLVAFSGGIDSTVLLHALHGLHPAAAITAVHFDHGLHRDSAAWSGHCRGVADSLGIGFIARRLELGAGAGRGTSTSAGANVEALAREARYAGLAALAGPGDCVLTAHHADDQLETALLRLLRGTGVRGLTLIHATGDCGGGRLLRPLLEFTRAEVESEARRLGLAWIEDPSNQDTRFDRNFLRAECLPRLRERWPSAGLMANRLAQQMSEAGSLLEEIAAADLAGADPADPGAPGSPDRIPLALLAPLSTARIHNALRHALRRLDLPLPGAAQLAELRRALAARADAATLVRWPGAEARVYRQTLYLLPPRQVAGASGDRLDTARSCTVAEGVLRLVPVEGYGIPDRWARQGLGVRLRAGGEKFRPQGHRQHKALKQWFQEQGIVPWMRARVPLLYHEDRLVAIADLALSDELPNAAADAPFWRAEWTDHAPLR